MSFGKFIKFYERIGLYAAWIAVSIGHGVLLWDVGHFLLDDSNWGPRFESDLSEQLDETVRKIEFVDSQGLTDASFRSELVRRATEDCTACGLVPFPGEDTARAVIKALQNTDIRQRVEFWHSLSMLALILLWVLNVILIGTAASIPSQGMLRYLGMLIFVLPFFTLLCAVTTPAGNILNFVSDFPHFVGIGKYLLYFSVGFPLIGWPSAVIFIRMMEVRPQSSRTKLPNPYAYKSPKERMRRNRR